MMLRLWLAAMGCCAAVLAQHLVAVLPATGNTDATLRLLDSVTLEPVLTAQQGNLPSDISQIIPMPGGSKHFVVSRGSSPISVLDGVTGTVRSISGGIGMAASAALLVPDASRLAVAAGRLYFFDAATETLRNGAGLEMPGQILDLIATFDSKRILVLSQTATGQLSVTAVDLGGTTETIASTLTLPGSATATAGGMMIAPNGRVYVSGLDHVYEIDPRTNRLASGGAILLPGAPGKATASPDGRYLILPNLRAGTSASSLHQITIANRLPAVSSLIGNDTFDTFAAQRTALGGEGMFGFTRGGHLYDVRYGTTPSVAASYADAFFSEGGIAHPVYLSAAFSNELFPRKMAITKASGDQVALYSVDLVDGRLQRAALPNQPWRLAIVTPGALNGALRMQPYNTNQIAAASARVTLPLVVRLVEPYGRGIYGAPVTFTSNAPGVVIESSSVLSGVEGFAQTYVIAGDASGPFTVTASSHGVPDISFTVNVPSTPNGADLSGLPIVSGNGQVLRELTRSVAPMIVQLLDLNGHPVANEPITWVVRDGLGAVVPLAARTDATGMARATFASSIVTTSESYTQAVVEAATATGKATFYMTTTPNLIPGRGLAPDPTVSVLYPDFNVTRTFNGRVGGVLKNAIGVKIASSIGPLSGKGIPNVGLEVSTTPPASATDAPAPPPGFTANCPGEALTDADGFIGCDLIIGSRTGSGLLYMKAGGFRDLPNGILNVTLGDPGKVLVVTGSNQTARVGSTLPTPLSARVTDPGNNVLAGVKLKWIVTRGTAVLSDSDTVTDSNGFSISRVQLGATPGPVTVRAAVDESVFALFTLTATITYGGITAVSGDGQTAFTGAAFQDPVAAVVRDDRGQAVPGVPVQFSATGPVVLGSTSALTDAQGVARINAVAGSTYGPASITASIAGFAARFNLRVLSRTPVLDPSSFASAASFEPGVTPCGLAAITGLALAPGVDGILRAPATLPWPYSLGPVDAVVLGGVPAPVASVSNAAGVEQVIVQTPCETVGPLMTATVRIRGLDPAVVPVIRVLPLQPAIFEYIADDGQRYASALRADGEVQGPGHPLKRGTNAQLLVTGLGPVTPRAFTNAAGVDGQSVDSPVTVGINDAGVPVVRAQYMTGMIGTFLVEITIPFDMKTGTRNPVTVAVLGADGATIYSPLSYLVIE